MTPNLPADMIAIQSFSSSLNVRSDTISSLASLAILTKSQASQRNLTIPLIRFALFKLEYHTSMDLGVVGGVSLLFTAPLFGDLSMRKGCFAGNSCRPSRVPVRRDPGVAVTRRQSRCGAACQ
jgi:hypothetical protein